MVDITIISPPPEWEDPNFWRSLIDAADVPEETKAQMNALLDQGILPYRASSPEKVLQRLADAVDILGFEDDELQEEAFHAAQHDDQPATALRVNDVWWVVGPNKRLATPEESEKFNHMAPIIGTQTSDGVRIQYHTKDL